MGEDRDQLQILTEEYQKLQGDISDNVNARQKLESQHQESKSVQQEFAGLDNGAGIYKLVGPVLLNQDRNEAIMAVDRRLEFIEKEIFRVENLIKESQISAEKKKLEILGLQSKPQEQGSKAVT